MLQTKNIQEYFNLQVPPLTATLVSNPDWLRLQNQIPSQNEQEFIKKLNLKLGDSLPSIPPLTTSQIASLTPLQFTTLKSNNFINKKQTIWVTFSREGVHRYPAALTDPKLATGDEYDVSFLGHPHRHVFNFKVWISVTHSDRDIEFIQFKRWLNNLYNKSTLQLDYKSCEMIADELYGKISIKYPNRYVKIQVDEDGENGCEVEYNCI